MSYCILENPVGPGKKIADFLPYNDFSGSWISGAELAEAPPDPIELIWDPDKENETRKAYYTSNVVLMLKELVTALREAGVNNLVTYPVVIRSRNTDEICTDYDAVNIIGAVAAANMEESEIIDEGGGMIDVIFGSLVIDESKARDRLLFRLAESVNAVVLHDKVKNHLLSKGGFGLTFTEPQNFCG